MLDENQVVVAVCRHLMTTNFRIVHQLTTREHGIDIIAVHLHSGREFRIEAKGATSSIEGSRNHGRPFGPTQFRKRAHEAFFTAVQMRCDCPDWNVLIGMAFPDVPHYRTFMARVAPIVCKLGFIVLFVSESGDVAFWDKTPFALS